MTLPPAWEATGLQTESGQAWVYQVRHKNDPGGPLFALKRLKNPKRRARFAREVITMERLRRQHQASVPELVDSNLEDDRPWFVMPWYANGSLEDAVLDHRFREDLTGGISTLIKLSTIVAEVHAAGFAHRDLKPANVLLSDSGVVLSDFGLCLELDEEVERVTETHEAVGSRHYIAPENEGGVNESVDQRPADFYAFGKLCWAVLAGRQPEPREQVLEPEHSLAALLDRPQMAALDGLLRDLLSRDPRVRLSQWPDVTRELEAVGRALQGHEPVDLLSPRESVIASARRVRSLTEVDALREQRDEENRRQRWPRDLFSDLSKRSSAADRALVDVSRELADVLTFNATTGGRCPPELIEEAGLAVPAEALAPPGLVPLGDAVCFAIHSPTGVPIFPSITIRVWVAVTNDQAWIVRVPMITPHGEREVIADFLVEELFRVDGPLPAFRQSTSDAAAAVVDETADLFVTLAEHYLAILDRRQNPANGDAWEGRRLRS